MLKNNPWAFCQISMVTLQVTGEMETGCGFRGEEVISSPQCAAKCVHSVCNNQKSLTFSSNQLQVYLTGSYCTGEK